MAENSSSASSHAVLQPAELAIGYARAGNIDAATQILCVPKNAMTEVALKDGLIALNEGFDLWRKSRHNEAAPAFIRALTLIQNIGLQDTREALLLFKEFSEGYARLHQGDAHGALTLFETANERVSQLNFVYPEFDRLIIGGKLAVYYALAQAALNMGDYDEAQQIFGSIKDLSQEGLKYLERDQISDPASFAELFASSVEMAIALSLKNLVLLEFDSVSQRMRLVRENLDQLNKYTVQLGQGPVRAICEWLLAAPVIIKDLAVLARLVIQDKRSMSAKHFRTLDKLSDQLLEAEQNALLAGERGVRALWITRDLKEYLRSLLKISEPTRHTFEKLSGMIFFVSFVTILIIVEIVVEPSDWTWSAYFFGAIIISLIVAFGYGAVRFIPLLKLYKNVITKITKSKN